MTEYALNQLNRSQLAELAFTSATRLAVYNQPSIKIELYYLKGHFIEISYCLPKHSVYPSQWRLYSVNHYPDVPESTKYLTIYLQQIKLLIE